MQDKKYNCTKCGCEHYETTPFKSSQGNYHKRFDIKSKKFVLISCKDCGYTEIYKKDWKFD